MADSEARPLLATYDATSTSPQQHSTLEPTSGRGKRRFQMRQQMKKSGHAQRQSVYKSVFSSQQPPNSRSTRKVGSPTSNKGGVASRKPNLTSLDQESADTSDANRRDRQAPSKHSKLYDTLNPKSHSPSAILFQKIIAWVIIIDALVYILSTEPDLAHLSNSFYWTEAITSTIFAIEYICRIVVCNEKKCCAKYGPVRGRWKYMCTTQALIDAFATFPFFVELVSGIPLPTLTYLRVFRLLRITRTHAYSQAMDAVVRVFYFNREILLVSATLMIYLVMVTSILMYYLRPQGKDVEYVDDPDDFNSISSTMVLSILMLTGQGGPSGNLPWYTQCVVLLTGIFSVAMFAIPASMMTWGFEAEAQRLGARAKKRALAKRRGEVYASDTSTSSSASSSVSGFGDVSTSDEEYMNIIGGDDGDDGGEGNVVGMQQDEKMSMLSRIAQLEDRIEQTNAKLDLILQKLEVTYVER